MRNTIALTSIYLLMLFAFAEGIKSLTGAGCSDWLVSCSYAEIAANRPGNKDRRLETPDDGKDHQSGTTLIHK